MIIPNQEGISIVFVPRLKTKYVTNTMLYYHSCIVSFIYVTIKNKVPCVLYLTEDMN